MSELKQCVICGENITPQRKERGLTTCSGYCHHVEIQEQNLQHLKQVGNDSNTE